MTAHFLFSTHLVSLKKKKHVAGPTQTSVEFFLLFDMINLARRLWDESENIQKGLEYYTNIALPLDYLNA